MSGQENTQDNCTWGKQCTRYLKKENQGDMIFILDQIDWIICNYAKDEKFQLSYLQ